MKNLFNSILNLFGCHFGTEIKELSCTVMTDPSAKQTLIKIHVYEYTADNPFQKEGVYPTKGKENSVFEYLTSHHLIQPFDIELIDWLKDDVRVNDHAISKENFQIFIRNFRALNGDGMSISSIHSHELLLVMVTETSINGKSTRGINHIISLVDAICVAEDMHNSGHVLFSPYRITENENMMSRHFRKECGSLYCFALRYK